MRDPATIDLPEAQRRWLPGFRVVLSADDALIYAEGHRAPFKISLSHAEGTAEELVSKAKAMVPMVWGQ